VDFNEARYDQLAMALVRPYANHLHLVPDRLPCQRLTTLFLDRLLFLMTNQQCQSTAEGKLFIYNNQNIIQNPTTVHNSMLQNAANLHTFLNDVKCVQ